MKDFFDQVVRFQNSLEGWGLFFKLCTLLIMILIIIQFLIICNLMVSKMDVRTGTQKVGWEIEEEQGGKEKPAENSPKIYR